jgi:hypothetical protein
MSLPGVSAYRSMKCCCEAQQASCFGLHPCRSTCFFEEVQRPFNKPSNVSEGVFRRSNIDGKKEEL